MSVGKKIAGAVVVVAVGAAAAYFAFFANREIYIPIVSKGSQHQFWQAVRAGAEQAAKDFNVRITFEGPESETMVDQQTAMLKNALANKPAAIALAAPGDTPYFAAATSAPVRALRHASLRPPAQAPPRA